MQNSNNFDQLSAKALNARKIILKIITNIHASHIASAYSCLDLLIYLYNQVLKITPLKAHDLNRDKFILSKGWGVSALYTVLMQQGFITKKDLFTYCQDGSKYIGCATRNGIPGIEATTGSMGHGLPIAVGMALAGKIQKLPFKVYVLISDGECDEGSTWESILFAGHHKLDNLTMIIDYNKWQSYGRVKDILDLDPIANKLSSFKWNVREINGHSFSDMEDVFSIIPFKQGAPSAIIANTIKGKGVSVFEDRNEWHYKTPTPKEIKIAERELHL
jgi:transketolase